MRTLLSRAGRVLAGLLLLVAAPAAPAVAAADGHRLTVFLIDRNGERPSDADAWIDLYDLATGEQVPFLDGTAVLPAGAYQAYAYVATRNPDSLSAVLLPRITLSRDTSLTMDARTARPLEVAIDRPGAALRGGVVEFLQGTAGQQIRWAFTLPADIDVFLSPTGPAPGLRARLYATLTDGGAAESRYAYTVVRDLDGGIPQRLRFTARVRDLAVRTVTVARQDRPACVALEMSAARSGSTWQYTERIVLSGQPFTAGFSPATDPVWALTTEVMAAGCDAEAGTDRFSVNAVFPRAGTGALAFGRAPLGPAVAHRQPGSFPYAFWADDTLVVRVPLVADAGRGHYSRPVDNEFSTHPYLTGETRLTDAQGRLVYTSLRPGSCSCHVPAGAAAPGPLRLTVDAHRTAPWSGLAVRQHVEWTFDGDPGRAVVPLLAVRYRAPLDGGNRAPGGRPFPLGLWVERHDPAGPAVAGIALEASFDDGVSWSPVPLTGAGDSRSGLLTHPATGYVSLRATATDTEGNRVRQTLIRAYRLAALSPPG